MNKVLDEITQMAIKKLNDAYGYCGAAIGENAVMLNSDDGNGNDITITIKVGPQ